jgi:hypothetical protein
LLNNNELSENDYTENELDIMMSESCMEFAEESKKKESFDDASSVEASKVLVKKRKLRKLICSNRQSLSKMSHEQ